MTHPGRRYPIARHWEVIAILPSGHALVERGFAARCRHLHATQDEATICPWTPDPWPEVCDLLVRQVRTRDHRDDERREQGKLL